LASAYNSVIKTYGAIATGSIGSLNPANIKVHESMKETAKGNLDLPNKKASATECFKRLRVHQQGFCQLGIMP
jgi:hypothetical protein